jgi:hypothetical protein
LGFCGKASELLKRQTVITPLSDATFVTEIVTSVFWLFAGIHAQKANANKINFFTIFLLFLLLNFEY